MMPVARGYSRKYMAAWLAQKERGSKKRLYHQ